MQLTTPYLESLMREAILEAGRAARVGEVPVGAIVVVGDKIISRGHNLTESTHIAAAHAEMLAIERASAELTNWRLSEAILVVTLEPCSMCAGAIKLARIPTVVFATEDPRAGAVGSLYNLLSDSRTGQPPRVISGILRNESQKILKAFFEDRRQED